MDIKIFDDYKIMCVAVSQEITSIEKELTDSEPTEALSTSYLKIFSNANLYLEKEAASKILLSKFS